MGNGYKGENANQQHPTNAKVSCVIHHFGMKYFYQPIVFEVPLKNKKNATLFSCRSTVFCFLQLSYLESVKENDLMHSFNRRELQNSRNFHLCNHLVQSCLKTSFFPRVCQL